MKCLVLAGGSSDRLWPLARREYPKQFLEIREGCSLFQEAILRNIPLCDEFIILTNRRYENIVKGQLQAFQGVRYRVLMDGRRHLCMGNKTRSFGLRLILQTKNIHPRGWIFFCPLA